MENSQKITKNIRLKLFFINKFLHKVRIRFSNQTWEQIITPLYDEKNDMSGCAEQEAVFVP